MTGAERPFFATAAKGTEGALRDELRELRLPKVRADRGGVHFGGELGHAMRACLRSRIAMRVLWRVAEFDAGDADALYDGAKQVDWSRWLDAERTVAVSATVKHGQMRHSGFVGQRIKDAVVDQLRERSGARPNVDRDDPDLRIVAHIAKDRASLLVDLAGAPLSRRGYRTEAGQAPLRESLAAAMLRLSGYRPGRSLLDPMCGSGTLPIEAALWTQALPPGAHRHFGFERWRCFDDGAVASWELEQQRARDFAEPLAARISGSDRDAQVLKIARANAGRAAVRVNFERAALADVSAQEPGTLIVTNPPYGVRLTTDEQWNRDFARFLGRMRTCTVVVLTPNRGLGREVAIAPAREHSLFNGDLECRLFSWDLP